MGAWIETVNEQVEYLRIVSRTLRGCVDWNFWAMPKELAEGKSHPTWVRGLKQGQAAQQLGSAMSHPTWVRGLKLWYNININLEKLSHPTWVRGLKPSTLSRNYLLRCRTLRGCVDWNHKFSGACLPILCRTLRGCVDWNKLIALNVNIKHSRTLRGCVDWNSSKEAKSVFFIVAPYVGAWIETVYSTVQRSIHSVAPYVGAWIETFFFFFCIFCIFVAPYVGAWIETFLPLPTIKILPLVAPYVGAWIETPHH